MLQRYRPLIMRLPRPSADLLRGAFNLARALPLYDALQLRRLCQADIVLALLHAEHIASAELLIGHPILRLPPGSRLTPPWMPAGRDFDPVEVSPRGIRERSEWCADYLLRHPPHCDHRRVVTVGPNPRLPTTPAFQRYKEFRPGRTVQQLLSRGVTRKDIREVERGGHVRLSA